MLTMLTMLRMLPVMARFLSLYCCTRYSTLYYSTTEPTKLCVLVLTMVSMVSMVSVSKISS
jgi:hypothetical protein